MSPVAEIANTAEFAVAFTSLLLDNMEREMPVTRKVIAAVPEAQRDFRPDPKSRTAFELAWHLAEADVDFLESIANRRFSMADSGREAPRTIAAMAEWYEVQFKAGLQRVRAMTGEELMVPVDFYGVMTAPVFRYLLFANNHSVHHRAQLATYLRPMGSKVPGIYGGSADEPWKG